MGKHRKRRHRGPWLGVLPSVAQVPAGGLEGLEREADAAVAAQASFVSTREVPYPSARTGRETDDLAAVAAGTKPAAWVSWSSQPLWRVLLRRAASQPGHTYRFVPGGPAGREVIVGRRDNVRRLCQLLECRHIRPDHFEREVWLALGVAPEAALEHGRRMG
jgi:hypothetical protein